MNDGRYMLVSIDPGGSSDPTGYVLGIVSKVSRLTKFHVIALGIKKPIQTPSSIVALVDELVQVIHEKVGRCPMRFVVDASSNTGILHLLAQALARDSLVAVKITAGEDHGSGISPLAVGEVKGRSTALPCMNMSRRQMLLDLNSAMAMRQVILPIDDESQREGLTILRDQMARASLKTTQAGRAIAIVNRGNDDLLMAMAQAWVIATRLPGPKPSGPKKPGGGAPFTSAAWT